ncbi:MAG: LamG-like jellyroll fold domain-containing protein [Planctomycetota bacterium]|jgi:hypothetical protein
MTSKQVLSNFSVALILLACFGVNAFGVEVQFDFNGNLDPTVGPGSLEYYNGATTSDAVSFDTASSFSLPALSGGDAAVMSFPAFAADQGFQLNHGAPANGGGSYVNQYTMIYDILVPDVSAGWFSFYNTNSSNSNDGDLFIRTDGGIGISGQYEGTINSGQWHRVAMVLDTDSIYKYIDGTLVGSQPGITGTDGRWALYTVDHLPQRTFLLTDDNGDTNAGFINSFYFIDQALDGAAIGAIGGPTAQGVVPEPATVILLGLGASILSTYRRRR